MSRLRSLVHTFEHKFFWAAKPSNLDLPRTHRPLRVPCRASACRPDYMQSACTTCTDHAVTHRTPSESSIQTIRSRAVVLRRNFIFEDAREKLPCTLAGSFMLRHRHKIEVCVMALKPCREYQEPVSTEAKAFPKCGMAGRQVHPPVKRYRAPSYCSPPLVWVGVL
jgi:hypothetical protein